MRDGRSVLISGAGIAGAALAYWLRRYGFDVTVLERTGALRDSGQNVDVRGAGRQVIRRMGLEELVARAGTGEVGARFVDERGATVAEFPVSSGHGEGATAELEILRGELVRLLVGDTSGYMFGDQIKAVSEQAERVRVTFEHATQRSFDLVIIAEGIASRTRRLVFGDEVRLRDLGQYIAFGTIPRTPEDDMWWRWFSPGRGRAVMLRPDNVGTTRALLAFLCDARGYEDLDRARVIDVLRQHFADAGWQAERILAGLADEASDLYLQRTAQVFAPHWSRGRIALIGDAAHCPSPVSGMGTSLALTGAYVLAGELAKQPDHRSAFASYERLLRPYVARAQKLPPGAPRLANPKSKLGVRILRAGLRLAATNPLRTLGNRLFTPPSETFNLPDYASSQSDEQRPAALSGGALRDHRG